MRRLIAFEGWFEIISLGTCRPPWRRQRNEDRLNAQPGEQPLQYHGPEPTPDSGDPSDEDGGSRRVALWVVAVAALVTLIAMAFIYYRSATVQEPTSAIVVEGDSSLDGAQIIVTSPDFPGARATLNAENDFITPLLLHPGVYTITITHNERVLLRETFNLQRHKGRKYPVAMLKAAETQPYIGR